MAFMLRPLRKRMISFGKKIAKTGISFQRILCFSLKCSESLIIPSLLKGEKKPVKTELGNVFSLYFYC